jgi:hypothetical protein
MDRDDASRGHIYEIAEKPLQQIFEDCKRRTTNKVSVYLKSIVAIGFVVAVEVPFACCVADVSQVEVHTFLTILGCHCSQSTALHTHQAHSFHVQFCVCVCVCVYLSLSLSLLCLLRISLLLRWTSNAGTFNSIQQEKWDRIFRNRQQQPTCSQEHSTSLAYKKMWQEEKKTKKRETEISRQRGRAITWTTGLEQRRGGQM